MRKIKLLETGKIITVTNNVAFGLVDSGKATYNLAFEYPNKELRAERSKGYKTR